jgi:hypothetical protein
VSISGSKASKSTTDTAFVESEKSALFWMDVVVVGPGPDGRVNDDDDEEEEEEECSDVDDDCNDDCNAVCGDECDGATLLTHVAKLSFLSLDNNHGTCRV